MKPKMNLLENLQQQTASFKEMYLQKKKLKTGLKNKLKEI